MPSVSELAPEERFIRRNLAYALVSENEYAAAWPHVERLLAAGEDAWWLHLSAAQICLYWRMDHECVVVQATRALELRPENARGHMLLGQMAEEQGDPQRAITHYVDSLARRGSQAEVAIRLAGLLADSDRRADAIAVLEDVHARNLRDARTMLQLARMVEAEDAARAEALYQRATVYHDEPAAAYGHLLRFYQRQGREREAEAVRAEVDALVGQRQLRPMR